MAVNIINGHGARMYGDYDWPERSSELSKRLIASIPITRMSSKQLATFKAALDSIHDLEERCAEQ